MKKKIKPVRATLLPKPMFSVVTEDFAAMLKECPYEVKKGADSEGVLGTVGGCFFVRERVADV